VKDLKGCPFESLDGAQPCDGGPGAGPGNPTLCDGIGDGPGDGNPG